MLVGIAAKLRNGRMLQFRERRGLTQTQAAELAGVSAQIWWTLENMNYKGRGFSRRTGKRWLGWSIETVQKIAAICDCHPEDIFPRELWGIELGATRIAYKEADVLRLSTTGTHQHLTDEQRSLELHDALEAVLDQLTFRQREVLKHRYGLESGEPLTLAEIGRLLGITKERVRQIELRAIRTLQENPTPGLIEHS